MKPKTYQIKFLLSLICYLFFLPIGIKAAVLYLEPQVQTIYQGDSFIVEVRVDSKGEEINTIGATLVFPSDLLRATDFSKGGSILSLWVRTPTIRTGEVSFMGGAPGGFKGDGLIGKITFLGEGLGEAKVSFKEDSQVLLHDPQARPAHLVFLEGNYEIIERPEELPVITSKSHPDQNKWYKETTLYLYWKPEEGAEYSWILSYNPEAIPDEIPDRPKPKEELVWMGAMEYADLKDGIYYFHLRQKLLGEDWSEKVTFRAMIDSTSPEVFEPEIGQDPSMFEGKYFLSFATVDKMSGIDHHEAAEVKRRGFVKGLLKKEEKVEWKKAKSPYLLEDQSLRSKIFVKAIDKAGNEQIGERIPPYKITLLDITVGIILLVLLIGTIWWIIKKIQRKKYKR